MDKDIFYAHGLDAKIEEMPKADQVLHTKWGTKLIQKKGKNAIFLTLPSSTTLRGYPVKWQDLILDIDLNRYCIVDKITLFQPLIHREGRTLKEIPVWETKSNKQISAVNTRMLFNIPDHTVSGQAVLRLDVSFIDTSDGIGEITLLGVGCVLEAQDTLINDVIEDVRPVMEVLGAITSKLL